MMYPIMTDMAIEPLSCRQECERLAMEEFNRVYGALLRSSTYRMPATDTPMPDIMGAIFKIQPAVIEAKPRIGILQVTDLFGRVGISTYEEGTSPENAVPGYLLHYYPKFEKRFYWLVSKHLAEMKQFSELKR